MKKRNNCCWGGWPASHYSPIQVKRSDKYVLQHIEGGDLGINSERTELRWQEALTFLGKEDRVGQQGPYHHAEAERAGGDKDREVVGARWRRVLWTMVKTRFCCEWGGSTGRVLNRRRMCSDSGFTGSFWLFGLQKTVQGKGESSGLVRRLLQWSWHLIFLLYPLSAGCQDDHV